MKTSNFTEQQIAFAFKQAELGTPVDAVCWNMGISAATLYNRRKKYGGLGPSEVRRLKQLEEENTKLKKLVADLSFGQSHIAGCCAKRDLNPSRKLTVIIEKATADTSGASKAAIDQIIDDKGISVEVRQVKYPNIIESRTIVLSIASPDRCSGFQPFSPPRSFWPALTWST